MTESRSTAAHRKAVAALAVLALACQPCGASPTALARRAISDVPTAVRLTILFLAGAVPSGTTEYTNVQIANEEWSPETTFGNAKANLQIGVRANALNSFQDIGFGYVGNAAQHKPPAVIAYEQTSAAGETKGDLVFGTRGSTSGSTAAVEQVRIRSDGTVDVESVRFTGSQIGISGDPDMIDLGTTAGMVTVNGNLKTTGDLTLTKPAAAITHSGGTSLSISSGGFVAVESVEFAGANIGISGDTNLMVLSSGVLTVDGKVASTTLETSGAATVATTLDVGGATNLTNTLDVSGATTLGSTVELLANAATVTHSGTTSLTILSTAGFVDVELVRFTDAKIGINGDPDMIDLGTTAGMVTVNGDLKATGDLTLTKPAAAITHSGATSLSISSGGFVDVELVRFTDAKIGINGDATMIDLGTTAGMVTVNGDLKATGDLTLTKPAAAITHSGGTSLSISSGGFVAVESVEFAGANIGISGDTNLMVLSSGVLTVDGKVASTTLETSGAATVTTTLDVGGATNLTNTLDVSGATTLGSTVELLANAATVTHSGTTSLSISSGGFVDVESVRFTDAKIGINGDATMIDLGTTAGMVTVNGDLKATGDLTLTKPAAAITHSGATSLSISSGGFVDVESVRFTDAKIGINGDATMIDLGTTAGMVTVNGDLKATGDLTLTKPAAAITHSGGTSLSISSGGFVAVESVEFAGANIGISGDTNLMVLSSGVLTVDGKVASTTLETSGAATVATTLDVGGATNLTNTLDVSGATTLGSTVELLANAATVTHSGTTSLTISSTAGFVDVELVRFTDAKIGISGDPDMIDLGTTAGMVTVNGDLKATGDLTLTTAAAAITHSGATSLSISSGGFVDVELVRFTDAKIGINGDATMIDLGTTAGMVTVNGDLKATGDLTLTKPAAAITHSGGTSLSISSGGFVAVESVEFAGANIGISGDTNLMVLSSGVLTVDGKVVAHEFESTVAVTHGSTLDVAGATNLTNTLDVSGATTLGSTVELLANAATVTHSGTTSLTISSTAGFVDVELVRFTDAKIGISGDPDMIDLGTTAGMVTVNGDLKATGDLTLTKPAAAITHSGATSLSISSGGFVDVELVRFTDAKIGINGDPDMIDLGTTAGMVTVNSDLKATGDLTLTKPAAAITHSGGTSLSISSGGFVDVELVRFTDAKIGINGDATMIDLGTTAGMVTVNGDLKATGDLTLTTAAAAITHSGATSLSISSGGFVAVESVEFAGANIGISGDTNLMVLSSGVLTVDGKVASTTLETSGAATVATTLDVGGATNLTNTLDVSGATTLGSTVELLANAATVTHSGTTSLSISSGGFVDVESVRFTDAKIGINGDATMIDLGTTAGMVTVNGDLKATGDLTLTKPAAAITHSGTTSLSISSGGFVDVELVRFTDAKIGINGDATMIDLGTTAGMVTVNGDLKATGDLTLTKPAATVTHSGTTSLSISSGGFVDVESVRFTDAKIGINGDATMIDLGTTAGMVTVNGDLKATGDLTLTKPAAAITHSGATSLSISSGGFVAVESVEFAGANIGISGDTNLMVLSSGVLTVDGKVASTTLETSGAATVATTLDVGGATNLTNTLDVSGATTLGSTVELLANAATVTHSGTTSLSISSGGFVDVESVRFTDAKIGINGDATMIDLGTTAGMVTVNGDLKATGDLTLTTAAAAITHSGATSLSISSGGFVDVESVRFTDAKIGINGDPDMIDLGTTAGMVTVNGDLKATGDLTLTKPAAAITHSGATSLSISSGGFVAVESVEFAGANIGISGDTNLMVLSSGVLTVDGKVASTTLETSGAATVATTLDVGGATNLTNTLDVSGATTLGSTVELLANAATVTHSGTTSLSISSGGFVDVESVRFTDAKIGINGDPDMIDLGTTAGMVTVNSDLKATGDLTLTKPAAAITHSGATSLSISSGGFVDVESVRFTDAKIGINGDPDMIDLGTTAGMVTVNGDLKATGDLTLTTAAAAITHSGATSLSISSGGFVAVESVEFAGANIGISGDTNLMVLSSGVLTVDGKVASTTLSTTGAATLGGLVAVGGAHSDATKELYVNGDVYATGTIVSASDARFKRNVKNVTDALDIARRVSAVTFSFRTEDFPERRFPSTPQTGVLAHELQAVLPDLVSKDDRGFKGVAYERLGVYALAAVKELDEEVRLLRAALDAARATLERMSDM